MNDYIKNLRDKYKKDGYSSLTNMEKAELLLSYSEKNPDNIKKSVEKILELHNKIKGDMKTDVFFYMNEFEISFESAVLLKLILRITKICSLNKLQISSDNFKKVKLNSIDNSKKFFQAFFHNSYTEEFIVVAVNDNLEIINHKNILSSESDKVEISHKKIYRFAKANHAENLFFAHCHPEGSSMPSNTDINTTLNIKHILDSLNINLIDHIIVGVNDETSMYEIMKNDIFNDSLIHKKYATKV